MYYTAIEYFSKEYDKKARMMPANVKNRESFMKWQQDARKKLYDILKLDMIESCDLEPKILEEIQLEDKITRQKVLIQVQPDVYMPMYILIPYGCRENSNARCMLAMSGHQGGGMESVVGIREKEKVIAAIEEYNYDYGLQLAKRGIVAICPETRGFGERRELLVQGDDRVLECSCYHMARIATGLGYTLMGLQVWDVMRAVDYICERNEWNVSELGILGFSGGGLQALYTGALDDRIKRFIISGYMYGYKESLFVKNGNCNCNYADGLWQNFDMGDIGAMLSPRKLVVQSGRNDHLNGASGLENVYSQMKIIESAYDVLDMKGNVMHDIHEGAHRWCSDNLDDYLKYLK